MSAAAIIAIAIAVVVVLGALAFVTLARRSDVRGAGALSAETRRRDAAPPARPSRPTTVVEHAADARRGRAGRRARPLRHRRSTDRARDRRSRRGRRPTPRRIGVSRRQFFNRATVTLMSAGIGAFAAAGFVAFLWPTATGGFGSKVNVGKLDDIIARHPRPATASSTPRRARTWVTEYPADALPKAEAVYAETILAGMEQGIVALYQKCPHLGCRVPRASPASGSSARATARSTTRSARRRAARRRAAWTASRHGRRQRRRHRRHRHRSSPARRSAPTPPARRPRARTASPAAGEH